MDWRVFLWINGLAGHLHGIDLAMRFTALYGPFALTAPLVCLWFTARARGSLEERLTKILP